MKNITFLASFIPAFFTTSLAFADCKDIGSEEWDELSANMAEAYDQGDLTQALDYCKLLSDICNESPIVNYTMSEIYRKQGDDEASYQHVVRASRYLKTYTGVPPALVERIATRRGEMESPYRQKAKDLEIQLAERDAQLAESNEKLKAADLRIGELVATTERESLDLNTRYDSEVSRLTMMKWAGTGVAAGGAVLIGTGAAMIAVFKGKADNDLKMDKTDDDRVRNEHKNNFNDHNVNVQIGYALLGAGAGLGIAGALVAIYSHLELTKIEKPSGESVSLSFGPSYIGIAGRF